MQGPGTMPRFALILELLIIFFGLPLAYRYLRLPVPALPLLWIVSGYAWLQLWRDTTFDRKLLWNIQALPPHLGIILTLFAVVALLLWLGVRLYRPDLEWSFVRQHRGFWAVVVLAYPALSVYPQGLLYRAFFFHRYAMLFPGKWTMIVTSAVAFAFVHIIFRNSIAVALTFAGGLLFAARYAQTGSLATSSFEHALYGCWLFTVGLGGYFYTGTIATVGSVLRR
jgi:membrane protease YdiL (CAAX protease family)